MHLVGIFSYYWNFLVSSRTCTIDYYTSLCVSRYVCLIESAVILLLDLYCFFYINCSVISTPNI